MARSGNLGPSSTGNHVADVGPRTEGLGSLTRVADEETL